MSGKVFPRFDTSTLIHLTQEATTSPLDAPESHTDSISYVALSSDSQWLVTASFDNTCFIWDFASGDFMFSFKGHSDRVTGVAVFADNIRIVSCSLDQTAQIWTRECATATQTLIGHSAGVEALALSSDNSLLVTGSWDTTCIVWRLDTYTIMHTLSGHTGWVKSVCISQTNAFVVSGGVDNSCILWDVETGVAREVMWGHVSHVNAVAIAPDDTTIVSGSHDGSLRLWSAATGRPVATLEEHSDAVLTVTLSKDGQHIYSGGADRSIKCWSVSSPNKALYTYKGHSSTVTSVCVSADSLLVVSAGNDRCAKVWSSSGGKCQRTIGRQLMAVAREKEENKKVKTSRKKDKAVTVPSDSYRRNTGKAVSEVVSLERDNTFSYYAKAGLYEVRDMIRRMAARITIIDSQSLWEQKDFVETLRMVGEGVGERVHDCHCHETITVTMRFVIHTLTMLQPVAASRPDIVSTTLDVTLAKILRDAYSNGLLEVMGTVMALVDPLPAHKLRRTIKCMSRINGDLASQGLANNVDV